LSPHQVPNPSRRDFLIGAGAAIGGIALAACSSGKAAKPSKPRTGPPNFVMIMTDDQDVESMRVLAKVKALIAERGITFATNIVSMSICCPSRATYLTGQYAHNHGVRGNGPPMGGFGAFRHQETTFPVSLQRAGYETIHVGKYLNGYGTAGDPIPPGWTEWHASIDPTTYHYYGYTLLDGTKKKTYGTKASDYQPDVVSALATSVIKRYAPKPKPFFLNVAYLAPHVQVLGNNEDTSVIASAVAAPRYDQRYSHEPLPYSPAYNEADVSDKPESIRSLPLIDSRTKAEITKTYDVYLESLLAVDDGVEQIITALDDTGQLENTVVMFTSDNGFIFGEHRIKTGKGRFYEPSIRVPLLLRGPGIPQGVTRTSVVGNIDVAPTILDLAGAKPLRPMDGESLVPLFDAEAGAQERGILLEARGALAPDYGLRTRQYAYFEYHTGEHELYDLHADPAQLQNRHGDPGVAPIEARLKAQLDAMKNCVGARCRVAIPL
jgi:N-acetylglucosamine-6-sulfatase